MKKFILLSIIAISTFFTGYSIKSFAIPKNNNEKIAVVDIQEIAIDSSELKNLKIEQEKQLQEIQALIEKAKIEISQEKNTQKALELEEKYRNQINEKKLAMDTAYNKQLNSINNKIKTAVSEKARSLNYNIVLAQNAVLFGGDDITEQVKGLIK